MERSREKRGEERREGERKAKRRRRTRRGEVRRRKKSEDNTGLAGDWQEETRQTKWANTGYVDILNITR